MNSWTDVSSLRYKSMNETSVSSISTDWSIQSISDIPIFIDLSIDNSIPIFIDWLPRVYSTTPSGGEGRLDRVSSIVFIALGLGGRFVSF